MIIEIWFQKREEATGPARRSWGRPSSFGPTSVNDTVTPARLSVTQDPAVCIGPESAAHPDTSADRTGEPDAGPSGVSQGDRLARPRSAGPRWWMAVIAGPAEAPMRDGRLASDGRLAIGDHRTAGHWRLLAWPGLQKEAAAAPRVFCRPPLPPQPFMSLGVVARHMAERRRLCSSSIRTWMQHASSRTDVSRGHSTGPPTAALCMAKGRWALTDCRKRSLSRVAATPRPAGQRAGKSAGRGLTSIPDPVVPPAVHVSLGPLC